MLIFGNRDKGIAGPKALSASRPFLYSSLPIPSTDLIETGGRAFTKIGLQLLQMTLSFCNVHDIRHDKAR